MRNLQWKPVIGLLTFFTGLIFTLLWFGFESKSAKSLEISPATATEVKLSVPIVAENSSEMATPSNEVLDYDKSILPVRLVKNGGEFCENYLLKKIAKEKASDTRTVKLKLFNTDDENLPLDIEDWLQTIHMDMITAFELRRKDTKVLILSANVAGATGIASNFRNWFIKSDDFSSTFRSLSEDPKLIFLDKNNSLNYYTVDYGDKFLEERDWSNVTMNLFRYRVNLDGESELLSGEYNLMCE